MLAYLAESRQRSASPYAAYLRPHFEVKDTNYLRILQIFSFKKHQRQLLAILLPIDAFGANTFKALKAPQGPISAYQYQAEATSPNSPLPRAPS